MDGMEIILIVAGLITGNNLAYLRFDNLNNDTEQIDKFVKDHPLACYQFRLYPSIFMLALFAAFIGTELFSFYATPFITVEQNGYYSEISILNWFYVAVAGIYGLIIPLIIFYIVCNFYYGNIRCLYNDGLDRFKLYWGLCSVLILMIDGKATIDLLSGFNSACFDIAIWILITIILLFNILITGHYIDATNRSWWDFFKCSKDNHK